MLCLGTSDADRTQTSRLPKYLVQNATSRKHDNILTLCNNAKERACVLHPSNDYLISHVYRSCHPLISPENDDQFKLKALGGREGIVVRYVRFSFPFLFCGKQLTFPSVNLIYLRRNNVLVCIGDPYSSFSRDLKSFYALEMFILSFNYLLY